MLHGVLVLISMVPPRVQGTPQREAFLLEWAPEPTHWYALERANDPSYWDNVNPRHIVIRLREGVTEKTPALAQFLRQFSATRVVTRSRYPERFNFLVVELPESSREAALAFIRAARSVEGIRYAEPNVYRWPAACPPNDPYFWDPQQNAYQWGYLAVGADSAWCSTTGSGNIGVAVIDAGVMYDHPDIQANYATGYDFIDDDADPYPVDRITHGTHVAGTIAAVLNNGLGVAGFGNFSLFSLRVCTTQGCSSSAVANALLTVAYSSGIHVANMSLGGPVPSQVEYDAADTAWRYGKYLVAAAGNETADSVSYPAAFPQIVAVSSFAWDGGYANNIFYLAPYSNYGPGSGGQPAPYGVELAAPGGDVYTYDWVLGILSTSFDTASFAPAYEYLQGTSMASPHVAGLAALVLSRAMEMGVNLPVETLRVVMAENAEDQSVYIPGLSSFDPQGYDYFVGFGAINAFRAIADRRVGVEESVPVRDPVGALRYRWDPGTHALWLSLPSGRDVRLNVAVQDVLGRTEKAWTIEANGETRLSLPGPPGVIFVRIRGAHTARLIRLVRY